MKMRCLLYALVMSGCLWHEKLPAQCDPGMTVIPCGTPNIAICIAPNATVGGMPFGCSVGHVACVVECPK